MLRKMSISSYRPVLVLALGLILLLSGCTPATFPLEIKEISVTPDPVIGQTAILHIVAVSKFDEPEAYILVDLPPGVKLMDGNLLWEGSLTANQPQSHEISICVLYEGDWRVWIAARSQIAENDSYGDTETLHLITTENTVRVVPGGAYRITQPPEGMPLSSTPLPDPPSSICP